MGIIQIFTLLGALGMFLYGMNLMSSGSFRNSSGTGVSKDLVRIRLLVSPDFPGIRKLTYYNKSSEPGLSDRTIGEPFCFI